MPRRSIYLKKRESTYYLKEPGYRPDRVTVYFMLYMGYKTKKLPILFCEERTLNGALSRYTRVPGYQAQVFENDSGDKEFVLDSIEDESEQREIEGILSSMENIPKPIQFW